MHFSRGLTIDLSRQHASHIHTSKKIALIVNFFSVAKAIHFCSVSCELTIGVHRARITIVTRVLTSFGMSTLNE